MKKLLIALVLSLPLANTFVSDASPTSNVVEGNIPFEHVVWNGLPISFIAPVGQERILKFPGAVALNNSNPKLTTDKVSILNNAGFLYITAKKTFAPIRIPFVIKQSGEVVLVDLSAQTNGNDTPVSVVLRSQASKVKTGAPSQKSQVVNLVSLMRYAIQHLYSPERLMKENTLITRAPMYTTRSVNLFRDSSVMAMPLVSWRGGDMYVTAVLLKNVFNVSETLDPRVINGHWLAASFYPSNQVSANGQKGDRTTMFLVSSRPFNEALNQVRGYA